MYLAKLKKNVEKTKKKCDLDDFISKSSYCKQVRIGSGFGNLKVKKVIVKLIHSKYTAAILTSILCTIFANIIIHGSLPSAFKGSNLYENLFNERALFVSIIIILLISLIISIQIRNTTKKLSSEYLNLVNSVWNRLSSIENKKLVNAPFRKATYAFFVSSIDKLFISQGTAGKTTCSIRVLNGNEYITIARSPNMSSKYIHSTGISMFNGIPCILNNKCKDSILIINDVNDFIKKSTCLENDLNQKLYNNTEKSLLIAPIVVYKDKPVSGIIFVASNKQNAFDDNHAHHAKFIAQTISFYEQYVAKIS